MSQLTPLPISPPPGVVKTEADRIVEGRWIKTDGARFVGGKPQKIGGNTKVTSVAASGQLRALHAWRDNSAIEYMAGGTYLKLYVYDREWTAHDITPLRASGTLTDPFTTTSGSSIVSVADTAHGGFSGDTVIFDGATAVGGLTIDGSYTVLTVTSANAYTIDAGSNASSSATGGGTVDYEYEINAGTEHGAYGRGYGVGKYGIGTYGEARTASGVYIEPRIWSLDHFGQVLIPSYNGGSVYAWDPTSVNWPRAEAVTETPTDVRYAFVFERFVIALCDELRIDWCSQNDYNDWTVTETNTAGSRKVFVGTKLVGGRPLTQSVALIWTDAAVYVHQYTGSALVFDTRLAGTKCGLISPLAAVVVNGAAYWMTPNTFMQFAGSAQPIPNVEDIRAYVFDNMNTDLAYQCCAMYVPGFDEIWWFYVVEGEEEPSLYVSYHRTEGVWAAGPLARLAATNFDHGDTRPYAAGTDGHIYIHEDGYNDNGAILPVELQLGPYALNDGDSNVEVQGIVVDFHEQAGEVSLQIDAYDRLRSGVLETETETVDEDTSVADFRICGRYIGLTIRSESLDGYFRFGKPTALIKTAGRRR